MQEILNSIELSITRQLSEKANSSTISLALGEPDLPLNEDQKNLMIKLLEENITTYSPTDGLKILKDSLNSLYQHQFHKPELHSVVTTGTQQALFMGIGAGSNPGDHILCVTPHYPSYEAIFKIYGLIPHFVRRGMDGKLPVPEMLQVIQNHPIKLLLLNSPNNPTGSVDGRAEIDNLYAGMAGKDITVFSDEVYFGFGPDDFYSPFHYKNTVLIRGISKTYGLTGFRLAWLVTEDSHLSYRFINYQQNIYTCPNTLVQLFVNHLLKDDMGRMQALKSTWYRGREIVLSFCQQYGIVHFPLDGSFYACLSLKDTAFANRAYDFAMHLLQTENILVVPGKAFGTDDSFFRINCLVPQERLTLALKRIAAVLGLG
ncbi:MAG: pyridoxal phosphate-dependent aminotransferase [Candidatus Cloacimonetes bacterium]|nr:pyridoxal phosphate-dependent aminotransferase [Candidatus Cloacimonadota bacterium]